MTDLSKAIHLLNEDNLVAIPTETVYGLAANAFSEKAIAKIYETKNRPATNPLIVHIASLKELDRVGKNIPDVAYELAKVFWPGPLTLVVEKADLVPLLATAGKSTVGVRMPNHSLTLELLSQLNFPLVAPSANRSNHISPTSPDHVKNSLGDKAPYILDGGNCQRGIESTIVGFDLGMPVIYRLGALSKESIEAVLGYSIKMVEAKSDTEVLAPGMSKKHYSPKTPFVLTESIQDELKNYLGKKVGLMCLKEIEGLAPNVIQKVLSPTGNLDLAASQLYATMHELDAQQLDVIIAEKMPEEGLGKAINDRLVRAASQ